MIWQKVKQLEEAAAFTRATLSTTLDVGLPALEQTPLVKRLSEQLRSALTMLEKAGG